jgi:hypothetical protein
MREEDVQQHPLLKYFDMSKVTKGGVATVYLPKKKKYAEAIYGLIQLRLFPYVQESLNKGAAMPVSQLEVTLREAIDAGCEDLNWFTVIPTPGGKEAPSLFLRTLEMFEKDGLIVVSDDFLVCKGQAYDQARIRVPEDALAGSA